MGMLFGTWNVNSSMNGEKRNAYRVLARKPERKRPVEHLGVSGWTIGKWIFRVGCYGLDSSGLGLGPLATSCEEGNEPSVA
jgi:hypothetical protein